MQTGRMVPQRCRWCPLRGKRRMRCSWPSGCPAPCSWSCSTASSPGSPWPALLLPMTPPPPASLASCSAFSAHGPVQFHSRCYQESLYILYHISQKFPQHCPWDSSDVGSTGKGPFSVLWRKSPQPNSSKTVSYHLGSQKLPTPIPPPKTTTTHAPSFDTFNMRVSNIHEASQLHKSETERGPECSSRITTQGS